ncbi:hypothetical protein [Stappia sp. P2PMeth1]|uniref:hypothetical protein n=1 Tax=Stappia sp. P2PMeth1 TaxID=2003586 RepID=UPI001644C2DD|nr:hypothetical protein [Stappia sp. P2PMeth1]
MKIAVACSDLVMAGGLIRFERVGQCIAAWGHELAFVCFSGKPEYRFPTQLRAISIDEAILETIQRHASRPVSAKLAHPKATPEPAKTCNAC